MTAKIEHIEGVVDCVCAYHRVNYLVKCDRNNTEAYKYHEAPKEVLKHELVPIASRKHNADCHLHTVMHHCLNIEA